MAQELKLIEGTMDVQSQPQMGNGKLEGCALTFEALQQDYKYLDGNFVKVSGTLGMMTANGNLGIVVKVVAAELDPTITDLGRRELPVSRAYLLGQNLDTNFESLVSSTETDHHGRFAIYKFDPGLTMLVQGASVNKITVGFALGDGGADIQLPLQLDVADINQQGQRRLDPSITMDFLDCTQKLLTTLTQ